MDVLVTSTCRKTFEATHKSFIRNVKYAGIFNFIVHIDVIEKERKYLSKLIQYLKLNGIDDMYVNEAPKGHSNAVNFLFKRIQSEFYFHLEDDWIFLEEINLDPLLDLMKVNSEIDHIRFNKERIKPDAWLYHLSPYPERKIYVPKQQVSVNGISLVKTYVWSFNPSLARTSTIKNIGTIPINVNPEQFVCHKYPEVAKSHGTYIYGRIGEGHVCKDIGRPHPIIRRVKSFLKNPSYYFKKYLIL